MTAGGAETLRRPRGDQRGKRGGRAGRQRPEREHGDPGEHHPPRSHTLDQATAREQPDRHHQGVRVDDPLGVGEADPELATGKWDRDAKRRVADEQEEGRKREADQQQRRAGSDVPRRTVRRSLHVHGIDPPQDACSIFTKSTDRVRRLFAAQPTLTSRR